jgi:hypothetical protein
VEPTVQPAGTFPSFREISIPSKAARLTHSVNSPKKHNFIFIFSFAGIVAGNYSRDGESLQARIFFCGQLFKVF